MGVSKVRPRPVQYRLGGAEQVLALDATLLDG
jgi:hypothetical protein